jgi:hypothetical protein
LNFLFFNLKCSILVTIFNYMDVDNVKISYSGSDNIDTPLIRPSSVVKKTESDNLDEEHSEAENNKEPLNPFKLSAHSTIFSKICWLIFLPINLLYFLTVPDCRRKSFKPFPFYFLTFLMSTLYMAILTYLIVWMVVIIGK